MPPGVRDDQRKLIEPLTVLPLEKAALRRLLRGQVLQLGGFLQSRLFLGRFHMVLNRRADLDSDASLRALRAAGAGD